MEIGTVKLSLVKQSVFFYLIMEHQEAIKASRQKRLVPDDKFDRHMKRARVNDIDSRKTIFDQQTADGISRLEERKNIKSSIY